MQIHSNEEKTVCKKNMCTGCTACVESCSKGAITITDNLKAYNAIIDKSKCVKCGKCTKVCPQNNPVKFVSPIKYKQGWALDETERLKSSSGGYATTIAKSFIENGGIVYSCTLKNGKFLFESAVSCDQVEKFRGSKYVKSDPMGIFPEIKRNLHNDKKVLFIGLPCQVGGLKKYLGNKNQEKLYTIDLICHGTPSPKLLQKYLKQEFSIELNSIKNIKFRSKNQYNLYENGDKLLPPRVQDRYTMAFLDCLDYTENCYHCIYAQTDRVSDISLGDSWGSNLENESLKGISLALCQTIKGIELLDNANIFITDVEKEIAINNNRQLQWPSVPPRGRNKFFVKINKGSSFKRAVSSVYIKKSLKQDIKLLLYKLKIMRGGKMDKYSIQIIK